MLSFFYCSKMPWKADSCFCSGALYIHNCQNRNMSVPMRQLYCIDEMPFAFPPPFFFPFNFLLSNWTNLLVYASIHSFLHFDVWSISTKIHEKTQGQTGMIYYLHCISKIRDSILVLLDIKAGSFSWSSTKLPRFSVLIQKYTNPEVFFLNPIFSSRSKQPRKCTHDNTQFMLLWAKGEDYFDNFNSNTNTKVITGFLLLRS